MSIEMTIRDLVLQDATVAGLVSTRGYQLKFPEAPTYPCFRVALVDDPAQYTHDGVDGVGKATVQIDAATQESSGADPYAALVTLADAIDQVVSGYRGSVSGESPGVTIQAMFRTSRLPTYDPDELRVLRMIQIYSVWYNAS